LQKIQLELYCLVHFLFANCVNLKEVHNSLRKFCKIKAMIFKNEIGCFVDKNQQRSFFSDLL